MRLPAAATPDHPVYMLQYVMLVPVIHHPTWLADWSVGMRSALGFAVIIAAALLLWFYFERPARRWLLDRQPVPTTNPYVIRIPPRT